MKHHPEEDSAVAAARRRLIRARRLLAIFGIPFVIGLAFCLWRPLIAFRVTNVPPGPFGGGNAAPYFEVLTVAGLGAVLFAWEVRCASRAYDEEKKRQANLRGPAC